MTKAELHDVISQTLGHPSDSPAVDTARMNFVGGLRSWGFDVTGGRKGGDKYQIVGTVELKEQLTADRWEGEARRTLDWLDSQPKVTLDYYAFVTNELANRSDAYHENSFGYLWSYELARDQGYLVEHMGEKMIVIKRFVNRPRLRIFSLDTSAQAALSMARRLACASLVPVTVLNVPSCEKDVYRKLDRGGSWGKRREAMVNVDDVLSNLDKHFNERGRTTLRKALRETDYVMPTQGSKQWSDQTAVLEGWKRLNLHKHRQPAMTRDEVAIDADIFQYRWVGYRDGHPSSLIINDVLPNRPDVATLIVEKSLNYTKFPDGSPCPGGKYGTADANMIHAMQFMHQFGIKWFNLGTYEGGGQGLPAHKSHYARREDDVTSLTFCTSFPHYTD